VTVAFYCKKYDPDLSFIDVNPVRLKVHIFFPEMGGAFDLDIELMGVSN
jgi:cysteine/histidine-rich domain-containing protein